MFVAYSDASIQNNKAILAFIIVFEEKSKISKRILVNQTNNSIEETLAFMELVSFLDYYNFEGGIILFDSNNLKCQLKKIGWKTDKYKLKDTKEILRILKLRTQVIPRKYNVAHRVCSENKPLTSTPISKINRQYYQSVRDFSEHFIKPSVLEEYRQLFNKRFATLHEAQMKLNKKIWLGDLVEELDKVKVYQIHDKQIKVYKDTIVKISKLNYSLIGGHWRVNKKRKKLKKMLE